MYMTWEIFLLFCGVMIQLITLIVSIFMNNIIIQKRNNRP